jgi:hypothetical protein
VEALEEFALGALRPTTLITLGGELCGRHGKDNSINDAQEIARKVLVNRPAVLKNPKPLVQAGSPG